MTSDFNQALRGAYAAAGSEPHLSLMQGFPPAPADLVTWGNFMRPPYNRWAFHNLGRLRPTISVERGTGVPAPLDATTPHLESFEFLGAHGEAVSLAAHLQASATDGWLVMKDGAVVQERYFNGHQPLKRHIMFSVTKSLVGMLAQGMVHSGELDEQALAADYVEELAGSAFGDATVRQLLDMAVAIDYEEIYDDPTSGSSQFGYACGLTLPPAQVTATYASLYEYLPATRKKGEHGGFFHYVTATTEALAWVMERASGRSCAQQLADTWQGLGCERDGFFVADPWGRNVAGAGFNATLRDMARYGAMLLKRGAANGRQLLPAAVIDSVLAGGDPAVYASNEVFSSWSPGATYRSQWYVYPGEALLAVGIHGQYLYVDFQRDVVIVKQSSLPVAESVLDIDTLRLIRALAVAL